jgi:hypothetical protein
MDIERISYYDFFADNPFLIFGRDTLEHRELVLAGFDSRNLSYQSSAQRFSSRRERLQHDLATLVAYGLAGGGQGERCVVYTLTSAGTGAASSLRSFYAAAYRSNAIVVGRALNRLSDKALPPAVVDGRRAVLRTRRRPAVRSHRRRDRIAPLGAWGNYGHLDRLVRAGRQRQARATGDQGRSAFGPGIPTSRPKPPGIPRKPTVGLGSVPRRTACKISLFPGPENSFEPARISLTPPEHKRRRVAPHRLASPLSSLLCHSLTSRGNRSLL